jgi:hypothetical protein
VAMADEQGHAKFGFELSDVAREGRLRDMETFGGPRHVQRVCYSNEGANMSKVHIGRDSIPKRYNTRPKMYWTRFRPTLSLAI